MTDCVLLPAGGRILVTVMVDTKFEAEMVGETIGEPFSTPRRQSVNSAMFATGQMQDHISKKKGMQPADGISTIRANREIVRQLLQK